MRFSEFRECDAGIFSGMRGREEAGMVPVLHVLAIGLKHPGIRAGLREDSREAPGQVEAARGRERALLVSLTGQNRHFEQAVQVTRYRHAVRTKGAAAQSLQRRSSRAPKETTTGHPSRRPGMQVSLVYIASSDIFPEREFDQLSSLGIDPRV